VTNTLRFLAAPLTLLALVGLVATGCGGGDDTTTATETGAAAGGAAGGNPLAIKMGDYFFDPKNGSTTAGPTKIEAPNEGSVEHELVVFKTDMNPADLPTEANGDVDEEKLDQQAEEKGEIADVEPGETKSEDFELTPGKYVIFCNLPGHYAQGMYGTITVTE
jgi:uncharacterized cupredoxin-like copper-binding protein